MSNRKGLSIRGASAKLGISRGRLTRAIANGDVPRSMFVDGRLREESIVNLRSVLEPDGATPVDVVVPTFSPHRHSRSGYIAELRIVSGQGGEED